MIIHLLLLSLINSSWALPFYPVNISTLTSSTGNLICSGYFNPYDSLCVIEQDTIIANSSGTLWTNTSTRFSTVSLAHAYKPIISFQNCSSGLKSNNTDIGYGSCSPRPFQSVCCRNFFSNNS